MHGGALDLDGAGRIAEVVLERVFARPMRADELLIDAGRGIVDWGVHFGVLPHDALDATKRPYGLSKPRNPPSMKRFEAKYGHHYRDNVRDSENFAPVWSSLFDMGDFGRYVVDSAMYNFSRYRLGQFVPERGTQEPRLIRSRWRKFIQSLTDAQRAEWVQAQSDGSSASHLPLWLLDDEPSPNRLTEDQQALYRAAWTPRRPSPDDGYPGELARRWVFQRVLSLGWTPRLFGQHDWFIERPYLGRTEHKAERWGKKYQWVAFHELLARVADNYQFRSSGKENEPYDGLQQMIGRREIDPSLPPISYREFEVNRGESAISWVSSPIRLRSALSPRIVFTRFRGDVSRFIDEHESEPEVGRVVPLLDESGAAWIPLDASEVQRESVDDADGPKLEQSLRLRTALVRDGNSSRDTRWLTKAWHERADDFEHHGHVDCCYAGEIGWSARPCPYRSDEAWEVKRGATSVAIINPVEDYTWESSLLDCSIGASTWATMPAAFLQSQTNVRMIAAGPSWVDPTGQIVATYLQTGLNRYQGYFRCGLFARKDWLVQVLKREGLALVILGRFQRMRLAGRDTFRYRSVEGWSSAILSANGTLANPATPIREEGPTDG